MRGPAVALAPCRPGRSAGRGRRPGRDGRRAGALSRGDASGLIIGKGDARRDRRLDVSKAREEHGLPVGDRIGEAGEGVEHRAGDRRLALTRKRGERGDVAADILGVEGVEDGLRAPVHGEPRRGTGAIERAGDRLFVRIGRLRDGKPLECQGRHVDRDHAGRINHVKARVRG